jgi:hypothetical protein
MLQTVTIDVFVGINATEPNVGVARDRDYEHDKGRYKYHSLGTPILTDTNTGPAD